MVVNIFLLYFIIIILDMTSLYTTDYSDKSYLHQAVLELTEFHLNFPKYQN